MTSMNASGSRPRLTSEEAVLCPGRRYEAEVPDTLDLADRARLALNGLGGTLDPDCHYTMFFTVHYACRPPYMRHHAADTTCDPKFAESFAMMRVMCGEDTHADLEAAFRRELVSRLDAGDGLYYNIAHADRPWRVVYNPSFHRVATTEDLCNVGACGRMLRTLVTWREWDPEAEVDDLIRALVRGLARIAIYKDDYAYYPDAGVGEPFNRPRSGWPSTEEPQSETQGGEGSVVCYHGHQIQGLMRWYAMSGDEEALDLAARLTRFVVKPKFWGGVVDPEGDARGLVGHVAPSRPDPPGIAGAELGHWYSHFHARAIGLRGVLEYARVVQDARLLEFVRRSYEFTLAMGIARLGWVNCWPARHAAMESCALGDLAALAIRLTDAGVGDYWDDVDALARNQLVEQQLIDAEMLGRISEAGEARDATVVDAAPGQECYDRVIERSLGNFAGMATPADMRPPWVMQCCTGNATQGLYYVWEATVRGDGDTACVNLLLNRASPWADVDSYLPYEGKVVVRVKKARRLAVRIPGWVERPAVCADVNGRVLPLVWIGAYLTFFDLRAGDVVTVTFPVRESTARYTIAAGIPQHEAAYTIAFRGSTAVDVSPRDDAPTTYQMYRRAHLRRPHTPLRKAVRFVADRIITRW